MTKLNQLVAIERDVKQKAGQEITDAYHLIQKPDLFKGLSRTYKPRDEDGELFPSESTRVQVSSNDLFAQIKKSMTRLFDITATKDYSNTLPEARGTVKLADGTVLVDSAPVPFLLYLEKELKDLRTFISKIPTLDPAQNWTLNESNNTYAADAVETARQKKVPVAFVKYQATDKHPAQVEVVHEDVLAGTWTKIEFSGAIPETRRLELDERVVTLLEAVKFAREKANLAEVTDQKVGAAILDYVFA